uniref:Uncharacterized protein n=1 Tax=Amphilophus citrinellus TaxID=61819 RepID=A0A3Q0S721_AMPCI
MLAASHSAANRSTVSWRPPPDEANRTASSAKSRDETLRPPRKKPSATWLRLEILSIKIMNRIGPADEMKVFLYGTGNIDPTSQDKQFTGRVSHFPDKLQIGNASITIKNVKLVDNGKYTCTFPQHPESNDEIILLVGKCCHKTLMKLVAQSEHTSGRFPCTAATSAVIFTLSLLQFCTRAQKKRQPKQLMLKSKI